MKQQFVEQIQERDYIDSLFLVKDKTTAMAKNGKPYLTLRLMDRSGEVEGRVWDRVDELAARFDKDDVIQILGKANVFMGKLQLVAQDIQKVPEEHIDLADFLPTCPVPQEELLQRLQSVMDSMQDMDLKRLLQAFWEDESFMQAYCQAPAAKGMHHVYLGGLLEHSLCVAELAQVVAPRYPQLQQDMVVAGALLHDIGKVSELCYARSFDYTDAGKLLGHIQLGVEMLQAKLSQVADFPPDKALLLKHLLLSHHGFYEYGSPKLPQTLEAVVLHFLDDMDSKINGVSAHIAKEQHNEASWTSYHRLYDRYFFKGESPAAAAIPSMPQQPGKTQQPEVTTAAKGSQPAAKAQSRKRHQAPLTSSLQEQLGSLNLTLPEQQKDGEA